MTVDLKAKIEEFVKANRKVWSHKYVEPAFIAGPIPQGHKVYTVSVYTEEWEGGFCDSYYYTIIALNRRAAKEQALERKRKECNANEEYWPDYIGVRVKETKNVVDLSLSNV